LYAEDNLEVDLPSTVYALGLGDYGSVLVGVPMGTLSFGKERP